MKLFYRAFKSVIIFFVSGDMTPSDMNMLRVGISKKVPKDIPVILDFTDATLAEGCDEKFGELCDFLYEKDIEIYASSKDLTYADAPTIEEVLKVSESDSTDSIVELLKLEKELRVLEEEVGELKEKAGGNPGENDTHANLKRENLSLAWINEILDLEIERNFKLYNTFKNTPEPDDMAKGEMTTTKEKILSVMSENGVPL